MMRLRRRCTVTDWRMAVPPEQCGSGQLPLAVIRDTLLEAALGLVIRMFCTVLRDARLASIDDPVAAVGPGRRHRPGSGARRRDPIEREHHSLLLSIDDERPVL